jgi:hypothetical protein
MAGNSDVEWNTDVLHTFAAEMEANRPTFEVSPFQGMQITPGQLDELKQLATATDGLKTDLQQWSSAFDRSCRFISRTVGDNVGSMLNTDGVLSRQAVYNTFDHALRPDLPPVEPTFRDAPGTPAEATDPTGPGGVPAPSALHHT